MVSLREKERMSEFVVGLFEESGRYDIRSYDRGHVLLVQKRDVTENPREIYVVLHNRQMAISAYNSLVRSSINKRRLVANLFYKDGERFHVRLGKRGNFKGDDRSLKRYSVEEINKMLHLRGLEKAVLNDQQRDRTLVYFQPLTERLAESVRGYEMGDVHLDYSHVDRDHSSYGFVHDRESIDYKIANEVFSLPNGGLMFRTVGNIAIIIPMR
jgi:hypothetical protein